MRISALGKCFFILLSLVASSVIGITITSKQLQPHIMDYALEQTRKVMTYISTTVVEEMCEKYDLKEQKIVKYQEENSKVVSIVYDTDFLNTFLKETTQKALETIKEVEAGNYDSHYFNESKIKKSASGVVYDVPIGLLTNNVILSNVGGTIPVKFTSIGSVEGNIVTDVSSFGINNALINISLSLSIDAQVVVPASQEIQNTTTDIPIYMHVINGEVPPYYLASQSVCAKYSEEVKL